MNKGKFFGIPLRAIVVLAMIGVASIAQASGIDVHAMVAANLGTSAGMAGLMMLGEIGGSDIMKAMDKVESKLNEISTKATAEIAEHGKVLQDTKIAIENVGIEQRLLADRLLLIEQKSVATGNEEEVDESSGAQFVKHTAYEIFNANDGRVKVYAEVKNTVTNTVGNTYSERRPGIVEGAFRVFTIEDLLTSIPASSNAVDWVRENVFTNAAAETTEGVAKPQSSITFTNGTMPIATVAHWVKISRQLAMDNPALAAYINRRMIYGVNLRVETQIVSGNGVAPNMSGLTLAGNFTAHSYTAASLTGLGLVNNMFDLIGKMIGDCALADYPADAIILNTADWWTIRLSKDGNGRYLLGDPSSAAPPTLWGLPVVASNAMVSGSVWVGSLSQAATLHNREGVGIALSDSDGDNFTTNLITIRAERRLALTVEKPAAACYGLLKPA